MNLARPVERSFYSPILRQIEDLGFKGVQELNKDRDYVDIYFEGERSQFILEVKIDRKGNNDPIIDGIVQAYKYGLHYGTHNLIVILFPASAVDGLRYVGEVTERALNESIEAVILTDYWYQHVPRINVKEVLENLHSKIEQRLTAAKRIDVVAHVIQRGVTALSRILNKKYHDEKSLKEMTKHLTHDAGLFVTLSSSKVKITKSRIRNETIDLLACILINQILFYFLYAKKSHDLPKSRRIDDLKPVKTLDELDDYFDQIRGIDYKPIFDILVTERIPHDEDIVKEVNAIIECLSPLKVEEIKQDLYGRLIGNSLPNQTRELLASYYTTNASADLLANLAIDDYSETVWDLACGSGTLLMSSYDRKLKLYRLERGGMISADDEDKLHLQFIQKDLTGTDIMPFACHLTGLNLSAKNLRAQTSLIRVARRNSLGIKELPQTIEEAYGDINEQEIQSLYISQRSIDSFSKEKKRRVIKPSKFVLDRPDRIAINPPFIRTRRLPESYRREFTSSDLSLICGTRIGLWGYFLALSHNILRDGGKIGAIIPMSILHGQDPSRLERIFSRITASNT